MFLPRLLISYLSKLHLCFEEICGTWIFCQVDGLVSQSMPLSGPTLSSFGLVVGVLNKIMALFGAHIEQVVQTEQRYGR